MKVVLEGALPIRGEARLRSRLGGRVELASLPDGSAEAERRAAYAEAGVVVAMQYDRSTPPAPRLRLLQTPVAGLDAVELAAVPAGAAICNVYEHEVGIAEYVLAGMLEWTVGLAGRSARFKAGSWAESPRLDGATRGELSGRTLALLGYGHIGQAVSARARAFGMRIEAMTRSPRPFDPAPDRLGGYGELGDMLERADFVVVACALSEQTRGLVDREAFRLMQPSAVLINVARGPIVDEAALYEAMRDRRIAGAVIDVWYRYATPAEASVRPSQYPIHELPNVTITPHLSGWTTGAQERRFDRMADNIGRLLDGQPLLNLVRSPA